MISRNKINVGKHGEYEYIDYETGKDQDWDNEEQVEIKIGIMKSSMNMRGERGDAGHEIE